MNAINTTWIIKKEGVRICARVFCHFRQAGLRFSFIFQDSKPRRSSRDAVILFWLTNKYDEGQLFLQESEFQKKKDFVFLYDLFLRFGLLLLGKY